LVIGDPSGTNGEPGPARLGTVSGLASAEREWREHGLFVFHTMKKKACMKSSSIIYYAYGMGRKG